MASSSSSPPPSAAATETRNWTDLPRDVTAMILKKLTAIDILESAQKVCNTWRNISKDPAMWRVINMHNLGDLHDMPYDLEKMARHAIDRSCGQLVDINLEYFATDELLQFIAQRASQLRCLRLVCCYSISDEGLSEAAKKLPLLEELNIYFGSISEEALKTVGQCCPRLTSLKLNNRGAITLDTEDDDEALAIAETMPGLRHLQLFGNCMTNIGLQAILDGCPNLESLDLRQCFNVHLGGSLAKRCSEQIKYLRCPHDSTDDYGFDTTVYEGYDDDLFDDYSYGFDGIDLVSDVEEYYQFSGCSDLSDIEDLLYDD